MKICEISVDVEGKYYKINVSCVKRVLIQKNNQVICKGELYSILNSIEPDSFKSYYLSFLCGSEKFDCKNIVEKVRKALSKNIGMEVEISEITEERSYKK